MELVRKRRVHPRRHRQLVMGFRMKARVGVDHQARVTGGFTMIELLVVVAIMILLVALLLPALDGARQSALAASCLSIERQCAVAYRQWVADNNDFMLRPTLQWNNGYGVRIYHELRPYLGDKFVWSDPGADEPAINQSPAWSWGWPARWHYGISTRVPNVFYREWPNQDSSGNSPAIVRTSSMISGAGGTAPVKLGELPYPGTTALFACKYRDWFYPAGGTAGGWESPTMTPVDLARPWPLHGTKRLSFQGLTNVVRLDGSARTYLWSEIAAWNQFPSLGTPPAGFTYATGGITWGVPRAYLWTGWAPREPGGRGGWLPD